MPFTFEIHNRWTGKVQFVATIEADDTTPLGVKIGLAVKWAFGSGADLRGADLRGAVLSDAVLRGAVLRGADLSGEDVPVIPHIDAAILASIEKNKEAGTNGLDMSGWHGGKCDETNWCNTTHCRAGYAVCLAGAEGFALEKKVGAEVAGLLIYAKSRPNKPIPDFYTDNETAMADLKKCAAEDPLPNPAA